MIDKHKPHHYTYHTTRCPICAFYEIKKTRVAGLSPLNFWENHAYSVDKSICGEKHNERN